MAGEPIVLTHLSDIHFTRMEADGRSVLNSDIRNELLRDIPALLPKVGEFAGVLVTGDVAFAGREEEYAESKRWLGDLCGAMKCDDENVWLVPGNHDIDRDAIRRSPILQEIQRTIRSAPAGEIDFYIRKYVIEEKTAPELLYGPLKNFLSFASIYSCDHKPNQPIWTDDLFLNDGSTLRLVGFNSTLVSNEHDDDGANKLVLGGAQLQLPATSGLEYLTLCHHPPQWLRDQDFVESKLRERARLQLFGHKHVQVCEEINRKSVRLTAGAMHPDQREPDWIPRYNVISLSVERRDGVRYLNIRIYPRIWNKQDHRFQAEFTAKGEEFRLFALELEDWTPPAPPAKQAPKPSNTIPAPTAPEISQMNPSRRLTYRFLTLPFTRQIEVAQELGLFEASDKGLQDTELFRQFFARARKRNLLAKLEQAVEQAHGRNM